MNDEKNGTFKGEVRWLLSECVCNPFRISINYNYKLYNVAILFVREIYTINTIRSNLTEPFNFCY